MTTMDLTDDQLGQGWLFHERFGYAYDKVPPGLAFEAYGKALLMCAAGDGLTPDERTWVVGFFAAFDSPPEVVNALKTFDENSGDVNATLSMGNTIASTPAAKRWILWDALNACASDGELKGGELARVRELASSLGVETQVLDQIVALNRQQTDLRKKQFELLWPDGIPAEYQSGPGKPF